MATQCAYNKGGLENERPVFLASLVGVRPCLTKQKILLTKEEECEAKDNNTYLV